MGLVLSQNHFDTLQVHSAVWQAIHIAVLPLQIIVIIGLVSQIHRRINMEFHRFRQSCSFDLDTHPSTAHFFCSVDSNEVKCTSISLKNQLIFDVLAHKGERQSPVTNDHRFP